MNSEVIIMRGLPGAGKSRYISQNLVPGPESGAKVRPFVASADHWFQRNDGYFFDPKLLPEAHNQCLNRYLGALNGRAYDLIVVDNTNISAWEVAPYYRLAEINGCGVKIVTLIADPVECFKRCVHEVPLKTILQMHRRMLTEELPPHWKHEVVVSE